ncbi:hypothetical protein [Shewanella woodyi]
MTLTMSKVEKDISELEEMITEHKLTVSPDAFKPEMLEGFS